MFRMRVCEIQKRDIKDELREKKDELRCVNENPFCPIAMVSSP